MTTQELMTIFVRARAKMQGGWDDFSEYNDGLNALAQALNKLTEYMKNEQQAGTTSQD
jgi:hypothetical protein